MSLDAEQRRWLEEHTLEELQHEFKRATFKRSGKAGRSSQYRGVSAVGRKWMAKLSAGSRERVKCVLRESFESESDAARAYDRAAVQCRGR